MSRLVFIAFIVLAACSPSKETDETRHNLQGYAEARLLYMAPRTSGPITALAVREGDQITADRLLFSLDDGTASARLAQAEAALAAARSRLADLRAGGRPQDINAARQSVAQARAALKLTQDNYERSKTLVAKGQAPQARLDQDEAQHTQAKAALRASEARLALVRAPARINTITAAQEEVRVQEALVIQAKKALDDLRVVAPVDASVQTVLRREGEIAGPAQPVLVLLPPAQIRIRFFIPEPRLGAIRIGQKVQFSCDGCDDGLIGKISFISGTAEFTPPVIFTEKERGKLVYMAEALPNDPASFHPGQPVLVTLP